MHRALYHRVGRLGIHDIEDAMDDLRSPSSPKKEAPSICLLSRSARIFIKPFVSPLSYARMTCLGTLADHTGK